MTDNNKHSGEAEKIEIKDGNGTEEVLSEAEELAKEIGEELDGPQEEAIEGTEDEIKADPEGDTGSGKAAEEPSEESKAAEAEAQESERYMRLMAEFQNYKKRVAKENADTRAYANKKIVTELLTVVDNFERALETTPADDIEGYEKGMAMIFEQLKTVLQNSGLKEIEAIGEEFDPAVHNAVMNEDSEEHESGKVSKVLQKGYTLNGKVIRPAMVAVAK
jgi:molecular chaperone GrpE